MDRDDSVVSVQWLHQNLKIPEIKVLDASWCMPTENRDPFQEYKEEHIPGALFYDVDHISDLNTNLPHMLPSEEAFASAVTALGLSYKDKIIVYDGKGMYSAPRVWWNLGFLVMIASGYWIEVSQSGKILGLKFKAVILLQMKFPSQIWLLKQLNCTTRKIWFDGTAPEPRRGVRSGHIPGSNCVPFADMLDNEKLFLPWDRIQKRFEKEGISLDNPFVVSCGTGVSACILALVNGKYIKISQ